MLASVMLATETSETITVIAVLASVSIFLVSLVSKWKRAPGDVCISMCIVGCFGPVASTTLLLTPSQFHCAVPGRQAALI